MATITDEGVVSERIKRGPSLYFTSATPDAPKAVVGILHGYADYGARYSHVMNRLADAGIASVTIDMRGHGKSQGSRGYCDHFDEFLDDADELTKLVERRHKGVPAFLFGHSFGGLVASRSAIGVPAPWKGLLLSAPFFGLALEVPQAKVFAGKIASRIVPKLGLPSGLHGADLTHDPEIARKYDSDPLVFKNATARWFVETQKAQAIAFERAHELTMPLYMLFGEGDKVAKFEDGKRFFGHAGSSDKTFDPKPGLFHEVLNEPSWKESTDVIAKWILAHL